MIPPEIGRYRNLQPIGRGGMGEIFRAEDPSLQRLVALKFIAAERLAEPAERLRLVREARAAAALSHPYVCTIHEVLESGELPVIVMEYVEGETLRDRLRRGPLPVDQVRAVGSEILEAIAAAHEKGIIHRDVKSANVMLTPSGHVKVMDFGLAIPAQVAEEDETAPQLTRAGAVSGTVTHMAPELLRGASADVATDLYAFGVLLYEMCAGRLPFAAGGITELIAQVLEETAQPPSRYSGAVPAPLDELVMALLERDRARRPPSARAALERLKSCAQATPATASLPSVAVLPFNSLTPDPDATMLGLALADATISELSLLRSLTVRPTAAILRYAAAPDAAAAGRELGADAVVHGTFQRSGSRLRVTAQLIRTAEARSIWATKIDTSLDDIFETQDAVSRRIAEALEVELSAGDARRLARARRPAGAAYEAYVGGLVHLFRETVQDTHAAIDAFRKAVEIDPEFALGWAALAEAYVILGYAIDPDPQWFRRAEELTAKALSIDPSLPEGRYLKGRLAWNPTNGWNHADAIREFAAAIGGRPNLAQAHDWMATVLSHVGMIEEWRLHGRRSLDILPDNVLAKIGVAWLFLMEDDHSAAHRIVDEIAGQRELASAYHLRAHIHLCEGDHGAARGVADRAAREYPTDVYFHPIRAIIGALEDDRSAMLHAIELTLSNSQSYGHYHHAQYDIGCAWALAGDSASAVRWLTDASRNGFPCAAIIEADPLLASLRGDAALAPLLDEMRRMREACAVAYRDAMTRPFGESSA